jgi:hypothetical protein
MVPPTIDVDTHARRTRPWLLAVTLLTLLLVAAAAVIAVLVVRQGADDTVAGTEAEPSATATPTPTATATPTPTPTQVPQPESQPEPSTPDPVVEGALRRLGAVVESATWGRGEVASVLSVVTAGCDIEPWTASQRLGDVVANREMALAQVSALGVTGQPAVDEAAATLQVALTYSLQADRAYQRWVDDAYSRYFYDHTTWVEETEESVTECPGTAPRNAVLDEADRLSAQSQSAKDSFVDQYNPLARQYGLPTWSASDF